MSLAFTAKWAAAQRARESERPDRLFHDPLAKAVAGQEGMAMLSLSEQYNPNAEPIAAYMAVRTKLFDDLIARAVANGVRQVVLPAAGMDSRPYRLELPMDLHWYELDQAELFAAKEEILTRESARARCTRSVVSVDLTGDWTPSLIGAGFDPVQPSIWIVEGLLFYLTEKDVRRLLSSIAACAARDSVLGADLVSASYFTSPSTKPALEAMAANGLPWRWGTDDPESFFAECGWRANVLQPGDPAANYGRWNQPVPPRENRGVPRSFLITAIRE